MIGSVSTMFHLGAALRRAAGRVFITFFLTGIIVAGATEVVGYILTNQHFELWTHIAAGVLGVGWAIALSLLVLVGEIVRGLVTGVRDAGKEVEKEVKDAGGLLGGVINSVEGKNRPK
ncbi:MAG TPA: hypothetical protein VGR57_21720 [Ktedonobacterales bacterium]|nr:hypothetical protein [Ktedonobacterales bacterium]